ncbi:MAG: hypothetical protein ACRDY0_01320 [Acidimicrobiales bacterium]
MAYTLNPAEAGGRGRLHTRSRSAPLHLPGGLVPLGLGAVILGAWGGIVPFVGPLFNYSSNGAPAWQWSTMHSLLYLVPGAVAMVAGVLILAQARAVSHPGAARGSVALAGLVLVACGAWFVIGPVAWPALGRTTLVFGTAGSATDNFLNQIGYNLGVGVLLATLGGMALKALAAEREVLPAAPAGPPQL